MVSFFPGSIAAGRAGNEAGTGSLPSGINTFNSSDQHGHEQG